MSVNKENNAEVGQLGQLGQFGQAHILNSNYYNLLIINDSNILEEKTRGVPTVPTVPTFYARRTRRVCSC